MRSSFCSDDDSDDDGDGDGGGVSGPASEQAIEGGSEGVLRGRSALAPLFAVLTTTKGGASCSRASSMQTHQTRTLQLCVCLVWAANVVLSPHFSRETHNKKACANMPLLTQTTRTTRKNDTQKRRANQIARLLINNQRVNFIIFD